MLIEEFIKLEMQLLSQFMNDLQNHSDFYVADTEFSREEWSEEYEAYKESIGLIK